MDILRSSDKAQNADAFVQKRERQQKMAVGGASPSVVCPIARLPCVGLSSLRRFEGEDPSALHALGFCNVNACTDLDPTEVGNGYAPEKCGSNKKNLPTIAADSSDGHSISQTIPIHWRNADAGSEWSVISSGAVMVSEGIANPSALETGCAGSSPVRCARGTILLLSRSRDDHRRLVELGENKLFRP